MLNKKIATHICLWWVSAKAHLQNVQMARDFCTNMKMNLLTLQIGLHILNMSINCERIFPHGYVSACMYTLRKSASYSVGHVLGTTYLLGTVNIVGSNNVQLFGNLPGLFAYHLSTPENISGV